MWTLRQVVEYLKFLFMAKSPESMHSPFMFELLPRAFDQNRAYYAFAEIELTRHILGQSDLMIDSPDRGAGSKRRKDRSVSEFVQAALSSPRQCEFLFRMVEYLKPQVTVEIGSALGISTSYLAKAHNAGRVFAFEGNPMFVETARNVISDHGISNVEFIEGNFDETLPGVLNKIPPVSFAFIDGNHRIQPTLDYFDLICKHASEECVIVVDDIRWTREMLEALPAMTPELAGAFSFGIVFLSDRFKGTEHHLIAPSLLHGGPILG